jgi:hypothetical protein
MVRTLLTAALDRRTFTRTRALRTYTPAMHLRSSARWLCFALATPLLGGCFLSRNTVNVPLHAEKSAALAPGRSTQSEVLAALGAPNEVVQLGYRSAWRYDHTVEKRAGLSLIVVTLLNSDVQQDRMWLFFDEHGVLACLGATLDAEKSVYELPWSDSHDVE